MSRPSRQAVAYAKWRDLIRKNAAAAATALLERLTHRGAPVQLIQRISFESVQECDIRGVAHAIGDLDRLWGEAIRNSVSFSVDGYNDDPRELCEIREVREYFKKLWDELPGLPYWIDIDGGGLFFLGTMLYEPIRTDGGTTIAPNDVMDLMYQSFVRLNQFCDASGRSDEPTSQRIASMVRRYVGQE